MRIAVALLAVTVIGHDQCGQTIEPAQVQQNQELVNLCEQRGGIPIMNPYGYSMLRCEFPPVAPIIRLPEIVGQ